MAKKNLPVLRNNRQTTSEQQQVRTTQQPQQKYSDPWLDNWSKKYLPTQTSQAQSDPWISEWSKKYLPSKDTQANQTANQQTNYAQKYGSMSSAQIQSEIERMSGKNTFTPEQQTLLDQMASYRSNGNYDIQEAGYRQLEKLGVSRDQAASYFDTLTGAQSAQKNPELDWLRAYQPVADYYSQTSKFGTLDNKKSYDIVSAYDAAKTPEEKAYYEAYLNPLMQENGTFGMDEYRRVANAEKAFEQIGDKNVQDAIRELWKVQSYAPGIAQKGAAEQAAAKTGLSQEQLNALVEQVSPYLANEQSSNTRDKIRDYATENFGTGFLSWAGTVAANPVANLTAGAYTALSALTGHEASSYDPQYLLYNFVRDTRNAQGEELAKKLQYEVAGQNVAQWLYQAVNSTVDSAVNMAITGAILNTVGLPPAAEGSFIQALGTKEFWVRNLVSNAIMGSGAAMDAFVEAKQQGVPPEKALARGIVAGVVEGFTEAYGGERIVGRIMNGDIGWVQNALMSFLSEGVEEYASNELNRALGNILFNEGNITIYRNLAALTLGFKAAGYSDEEAWKAAAMEALQEDVSSFLAGGLSGLLMGGIGTGIQSRATARLNNLAINNDMLRSMAQETLAVDENNKIANRTINQLDANKRGFRTATRMLNEQERVFTEQDKGKIQTAVAEQLRKYGETGNINAIAQAITKKAAGGTLTSAEQILIDNSKYGTRVSNEISPENIRSQQYNSEWAENIGTRVVNPTEYSKIGQLKEQQRRYEQDLKNSTPIAPKRIEVQKTGNDVADSLIEKAYGKELSGNDVRPVLENKEALSALESVVGNIELNGKSASEQRAAVRDAVAKYAAANPISTQAATPADLDAIAAEFGKQAEAIRSIYRIAPTEDLNAFRSGVRAAVEMGYAGSGEETAVSDSSTQSLTEIQRRLAYGTGASMKAEEDLSNIKTTGRRKGVVRATGMSVKDINARFKSGSNQASAFEILRRISEITGFTIELFDSASDNYNAEQGSFDRSDDVIRIDISSGLNDISDVESLAKYVMLRTFCHEFTHVGEKWAPEEYNILRTAVVEALSANEEFDLDAEIAKVQKADYEFKKNKYTAENIRNGMEAKEAAAEAEERAKKNALSWDKASREVVAEAMTDVLPESSFIENVTKKSPSLAQKILNSLRDFVARIREYWKGIETNRSREAQALKVQIGDTIKYLDGIVDKWDAMATAAVENYQNAPRERTVSVKVAESEQIQHSIRTLNEAGFGYDPDTHTVYSQRYSTGTDNLANVNREELLKSLMLTTGRTRAECERWLRNDEALSMSIKGTFLDFAGNEREVAIKNNSDYPQGTVDLSNICTKRIGVTNMTNRLQEALPEDLFTADDYADIRLIMMDDGRVVACGLCFVEDRRQYLGEIAQEFIKEWNSARTSGNTLARKNSKGEAAPVSIGKDLARRYNVDTGRVTPSDIKLRQDMFISTTQWFNLQKAHPEVAAAFEAYNNARGQSAGRLLLDRAEYKREILSWSPEKVKAVNDVGGLRIFSFSDFEVVHLVDLIQIIEDCAAKGVMIQGYTKQPKFAKLASKTGIKLNRSFIPYGATGLKTVNGRQVLAIDTVEGINNEDADFLDEEKNPNVGNNITGINDDQIRVAMKDPFFHYIIPFHTNKKGSTNEKLGVGRWRNYKAYQTDKTAQSAADIQRVFKLVHQYQQQGMSPTDAYDRAVKETGAEFKALKEDKMVNIYTDVLKDPSVVDEKTFVEKFLAVCKERNIVPRYPQFLNTDADGNFLYTEGYSKFLVDFKLFDYTTGELLPQGLITPDFDSEYLESLVADEAKKNERERTGADYPEDLYKDVLNYIKAKHGYDDVDMDAYEKYRKIIDDTVKKANRDVNGTRGASVSPSANTQYSMRDTDYLSAVERGDMETAQRMVDEAAVENGAISENGKPIDLYHGTKKFGFTSFDLSKMDDGKSIFLTDSLAVAKSYSGTYAVKQPAGRVIENDNVDRMSLEDAVKAYNKLHPNDSQYKVATREDIQRRIDDLLGKVKQSADAAQRALDNDGFFDILSELTDRDSGSIAAARAWLQSVAAFNQAKTAPDLRKAYEAYNFASSILNSSKNASTLQSILWNVGNIENLANAPRFAANFMEQLGKPGVWDGKWSYWTDGQFKEILRDELNEIQGQGNYRLYAFAKNLLTVDAAERVWDSIPFVTPELRRIRARLRGIEKANNGVTVGNERYERLDREFWDKADELYEKYEINVSGWSSTRAIAAWAKDNGYDGVKFEEVIDVGGDADDYTSSDVYVIFDPTKVKSAEPVTYDADGNVIPLEDRFNTETNNIQYQARQIERKDPRTLTEDEALLLFRNVAENDLRDNRAMPVRVHTPNVLIWASEQFAPTAKAMGIDGFPVIKDNPLAMTHFKANQATAPEDERFEASHGHGYTPEQVVEIIKKMDDPQLIFYETEGANSGHFAEVINYETQKYSKALVAIDPNNYVHENAIDTYSPGLYNYTLTIYPINIKKSYLQQMAEDGEISSKEISRLLVDDVKKLRAADGVHQIYEKKGSPQGRPGRQSPSLLNSEPFFTGTISQPGTGSQGESGRYLYRGANEGVMPDVGYAMFTEDENSAEYYSGSGHGRMFRVSDSDLVPIESIQDAIANEWDNTDSKSNYDLDDIYDLPGDEVAALFDPSNIVDSAGAWDRPELIQWAAEHVDGFADVSGYRTQDGGVVFDESIAQEYANPYSDDAQNQLRPSGYSDREVLRRAAEAAKAATQLENKDRISLNEQEKAALFIFQSRLNKLDQADAKRLELLEQRRDLLKGRKEKEVTGDEKAALRKIQNNLDTINAQRRRLNDDLLRVEEQKVLHTVLQKARGGVESDLVSRGNAEMRAMRENYEGKLAEQKQQSREKLGAMRESYKEKLAAERQSGREKLKAYKLNRNERDDVNTYKARVTKKANTLLKWVLTNSDKEHVPAQIRGPLAEFLQTIDFSSKRSLKGGAQTQADAKFAESFAKLADVIDRQQKALDSDTDEDLGAFLLLSEENREFMNDIVKMLASFNGTFTVNQMNSQQLAALDKFLTNLTKAVRDMNKLLSTARYQNLPQAAQTSMKHFDEIGDVSTLDNTMLGKFLEWKNATPYYAFRRFGEVGEELFNGLTKGWEKLAFTAKDAMEFTEKLYKDSEVSAWRKTVKSITLENKQTIRMTVPQIMALSQLIQREQAMLHIEGGGIRIGNFDEARWNVKGVNIGTKTTQDTNHYHLTQGDILNIVGQLSERQRYVATEMQKYMERVGSRLGNEISRALYGYDFYGQEDFYFPIETDRNDRPKQDTDEHGKSVYRLLNASFTKSLNKHANNALVVNDIFSVFSSHMADMAKLNALGLPILDITKWMNYHERYTDESGQRYDAGVRTSMEKAFGTAAESYLWTLLKDINGDKGNSDRGAEISRKMMSRYKIAAVAANIRVALLQGTSYTRALLTIDAKHLAAARAFGWRKGYDEAMKYSGTAVWKDLGYYDTDITRDIESKIANEDTWVDKIVEGSMFLAERGDQRTWGRLWIAAKMQVKEQNPGLEGEDLKKATADLFRKTIYASQVMDSPITRSELMRGTSLFTKGITAFGAEPTLSTNIVMDAAYQFNLDRKKTNTAEAWRKNKGRIGLAFAAYVSTAVAAALVESLIDAMRDDDDYENFFEKFWQAFFGDDEGIKGFMTGNLAQDLTIIGKIPVFKDVINLVLGRSRTDMSSQALESLLNVYKVWKNQGGSMTDFGRIYKTLQGLSSLTGLAAYNAVRDIRAAWNSTVGYFAPSMKLRTYDAGPKSEIRTAYNKGLLTEDEAIIELTTRKDDNGKTAAKTKDEARKLIWQWDHNEDGAYADLIAALDSGKDAEKIAAKMMAYGYTEDQINSKIRTHIKDMYVGTEDAPATIGYDRAVTLLARYTGITKDEATVKVDEWRFEKAVGGDANISASAAHNYYEYAKDAGVSEKEFYEVWDSTGDLEADKDTDGDSINGTKKAKVLDWLDNLSVSNDAKDALYYSLGYTEDHIDETPWHMTDEDASEWRQYFKFIREIGMYVSQEQYEAYKEYVEPSGISAKDFADMLSQARSFTSDKDANGKTVSGSKKKKVINWLASLNMTATQKDAIYLALGYAQSQIKKTPWH